jgi:hypothetical protein
MLDELKRLLADLAAYAAACFWKTIEMRERRRAALTFVAALLALPIALVFGGTSTPAIVGIFVTTLAFLQLFVVAPFEMWRQRSGGRSPLRFNWSRDEAPPSEWGARPYIPLSVYVTNDGVATIDDVQVELRSVQSSLTGHQASGQNLRTPIGESSVSINPGSTRAFLIAGANFKFDETFRAVLFAPGAPGETWFPRADFVARLRITGRNLARHVETTYQIKFNPTGFAFGPEPIETTQKG